MSPSSWGLWCQCRLAFAARYIDGERDDGSVHTVAGSAFHVVPELVYLHEPEVRPKVAPVVKEYAIEEHRGAYEAHGGTVDDLAAKVHEWWLMLTSLETPVMVDVVSTEERHDTELNGVPVVVITDRVVRVPGRRRREVPEHRLDDFKSGKKRPARRQMVMGAAVIEQRYGVKVPLANLIYVASGQIDEVQTGPTAQKSVLDDLAVTWEAMREAELTGDFPASPSALCEWCSHYGSCKQGQRYVREHGTRRRT